MPVSGLATSAKFDIVGTPSGTYTVSTPTLTFTGAAGNLTSIGPEAVVAGTTLGTLPASGTDSLFVGGHFDITPSTTVGAYTGTLSITVNFP